MTRRRSPRTLDEKRVRRSQRPSAACPQEKVGYLSVEDAKAGAKRMHARVLAEGQWARNVYIYECRECRYLHLTKRRRYFYQAENELLLEAPPLDMQLWAMSPEHRAARLAEQAEQSRRALGPLPDPQPEPSGTAKQPYANRPRNLRPRQ